MPFDEIGIEGAVNRVNTAVDSSLPCFVSTPNLNFVIATQSDSAFFNSVVDSDLSVADGMPLIWVAKLLGLPINERVAGSTLFDELSKRPRKKKIKVFFFGGQDGVADKAHCALNEMSKGMVSCGFYDPGFVSIDEMSIRFIVDEINQANPDFIVVALGAKKGQQWIQKNCELLNAPVISHLGAVINFVAGSVERAPVIWQRLGVEWVWRIKQEPALWKRYLFDGLCFFKLLLLKVFPLAIYGRALKRCSCFDVQCDIFWINGGKDTIHLSGGFRYGKLKLTKEFLSTILLESSADLIMDFSAVSYVDGAFIATLLLFQRELQKQSRALTLSNVPMRIKILMRLNNVYKRFEINS